ncbi:MAG TPA: redoxin domain-containing protein [Candidatus Paceibacterota bacterium]|jgi:thiol-disulfide isomerase/thioredoxin|nr:redoxin domain-containing protein [Candidatus Paceibacterota bacterium]
MSTGKKITFVVILVAVVGTIIYLESLKMPRTAAVTVLQTLTATSTSTSSSSSTTASSGFLASRSSTIAQEAQEYPSAPEITDPTGWINTQPFTLSSLVGKKVVLLDFWTYSCINCIRTLPYLEAWYQKYASSGLEIVGIHTPEFQFEHDIANVQAAVQKFGITYPVVLDSNMGTWNAYQNLYWPAEYLINIDGFIVHNSIGEGNYAETETAIQSALVQRAVALGLPTSTIPTGTVNPTSTIAINYNDVASPETYFGSARNGYLGNGAQSTPGAQTLTLPATTDITANTLYLGGTWNFSDQYATNESAGATILYEYDAMNVYMVASSANPNQPVTLKLTLDGKPLGGAAGSDVSATSSTAVVQADRLYNLVSGQSYGAHVLQITVENQGLDAYTFTFG